MNRWSTMGEVWKIEWMELINYQVNVVFTSILRTTYSELFAQRGRFEILDRGDY